MTVEELIKKLENIDPKSAVRINVGRYWDVSATSVRRDGPYVIISD